MKRKGLTQQVLDDILNNKTISSTKFVFDTNSISAALIEGSVNDLALDKAFKTPKSNCF